MRSAPLGELVEFVGGGTPPRGRADYFGGPVPWITPKDMKAWNLTSSEVQITEDAVANSAAKPIPPNAVLVVVRSGVLKRTLPVAINRVPATVNQDMKALICGEDLAPDYLARFLKWSEPRILGWARATTADNIPVDRLRTLEVPLPPLVEQRRIAAMLDRADGVRRKRREAIRLLDEVLRTAFLEMFGDPVRNEKGWEVVRLGDVGEIQGGLQLTSRRATNPLEVPYLRVANVYRDELHLTEIKHLRVAVAELERTRVQAGDVLIVEGHGNPQEIGRSAVWDGSLEPCVHQNHLIRVRLELSSAEPSYVSAYLNSAAGRRQMHRAGKTTSGLNTISTSNVKAVSVVLPPLSEQRRYVAVRTAALASAERMTAAGDVSEGLFNALGQRAFRSS